MDQICSVFFSRCSTPLPIDLYERRDNIPTIHIAGDSTAVEKDENKRPETDWGEKISAYSSPEIRINNQAKNGRGTKPFIQEGRLAHLASQLRPNDPLFVQFGHNDQKIQEERGTLPFGSYLKNLQILFERAKEVSAQMVLLVSMTRRDYLENGTLNPDILGDYLKAIRAFAEKYHIPPLGVFSRPQELFQTFSKEEIEKFYLHPVPDAYKNYPEGLRDNTRSSPEGVDKVVRIIVKPIKESRPPLANYLQKGV